MKSTGKLASLGAFAAGTLFLACLPTATAQLAPEWFRITEGVSRNHMGYHQMNVAKGTNAVLAELKGPGKVTYFYITDDTQVRWYPGLVLKVFWDDETEPSIQAPLADFFGAMGGRTIDYQSAAVQINHACYMWQDGQVPSRDDYTSVAFWYQEEPHQTFKLQPFAERTSPTRAAEYK